jgi:hypothetical protein
MKTVSNSIMKRGLSITASALLVAALVGLLLPESPARAAGTAASDRASFLSPTGQLARSPGSPVGPPKKIVICHKRRTLSINANAWLAHQRHGDHLGPCH